MSVRHLRRKLAGAVALILLAAGASSCASSGAATNADGTTTIRYQTYIGMLNLPELADALGYLDDFKLDRVGDVQGGPEGLRAVATNQVDYAGAFNGAIAKVAATGVPVTAVISYYGSNDDVNFSFLVNDDSGIKEARDLIGKKVAVNTLGANAEAVLDTYLEQGGLSADEIDKVTLVPLPSTTSESSLREGQVDAAFMGGTAREVALQRPGLKELFSDIDVVGPYNGGSLVMRDDFIQKFPDVTKEFVSALGKALDWANSHEPEEVRKVMADYLTAHDRKDQADALALWKGTGVSTPGGAIQDQDFTLWLDWLEKAGEVDAGSIEPSEIYTNKFNSYAEEG
jgi:ABC-type nitrate/sulfonate/bicarbonate transport system substrate-binding protein